jgi:hypothetical protein
MKKWCLKVLMALACLGMLGAAYAQDPQPVGTVRIISKSVAVGVGVTWGRGNLDFQGAHREFTVDGLSVIDLGISKITTTGEVFYLNDIKDFAGNYVAGAAGIAVAGGINDVIMRNEHGVVLRLRGTEKGVRLQLGAQGVTIKLQ